MTSWARRGRPLMAVVAVAACTLPGCRCSGEPTPSVSEGLAACRAACASYVSAHCPGRAELAKDQADCVAACGAESEVAGRAECSPLRAAYLDCVGHSSVDCAAFVSAPSVALARGEGVRACGQALGRLDGCTAPCRNEGSVHLGDSAQGGHAVQAELTRDGCNDCRPKTRAGAPPGSPCTAARVCAEQCCSCQEGAGHYRARVCIDGACADQAAACASAPSAASHDPCMRAK